MASTDLTTTTTGDARWERQQSVGLRARRAAAAARRTNAIELGVMTTPPTVVGGSSSLPDAALTNAFRVSSGQANCFRFTGGTPQMYAGVYYTFPVVTTGANGNTPGDSTKTTWQCAVEWYSDAPKLAIRHLTTSMYQLEVDDQAVSATTFTDSNQGGTRYISVDFAGVAKVRKYRLELWSATGFDGVYVPTGYSVWPVKSDTGLVVASVGDSVDAGTGVSEPGNAWQNTAGKLLGFTDVRMVALGGTGFTNAGTWNNVFASAARIADVVAINPDILIISASQNDDLAGATAITAATLAGLKAYRAALPNAPIVVCGVDAGSSGPTATRLATEAATLAAFTAWADTNSWYIPVAADPAGSWFTGTGWAGRGTFLDGVTTSGSTTFTSATANFGSADVGSTLAASGIPAGTKISSVTNSTTVVLSAAATATATGVSFTFSNPKTDGNRDRYGFDGAHCNSAGHRYRGARYAQAFRQLVLPYLR
jgi:lysophospholipase L1-like esterase